VDPVCGWWHPTDVDSIPGILETLNDSIFKMKWVPNNPCQYLQYKPMEIKTET
jgi:hypothetical protein